MNIPTIVIAVIVFLILALVIIKLINDKKNNVPSCGGGCKGCPNAALCHSKNLKNNSKNK